MALTTWSRVRHGAPGLARAALGAVLVAVPLLLPAAVPAGGTTAGWNGDDRDLGWSYNCRGLFCLFAACTSGVGLRNIHYYQFGVNVEPSDRPGYERMITELTVVEHGARFNETSGFTEMRISIGPGGGAYDYTRRLQPAELGEVIELPAPVYIRPGYRKYVGIYVDTNVPGEADDDHGQKTGDCRPILA